jgi:shikimate dehydrogenase
MFKLALIGKGISHSFSPGIHRLGAAMSQVSCSYDILDFDLWDQVRQVVGELRQGRWDGFNVTTPYKTEILSLLEHSDRSAVNTIFLNDGHVWGTSTDGFGFDRGLINMELDPETFHELFFLGCGGAVLSIMEHCYLRKRPLNKSLQVHILARSEESTSAQKLKAWAFDHGLQLNFYVDFEVFKARLYPEALLVQATPKNPLNALILDENQLKSLPKSIIFYDLNYGLQSHHAFWGAKRHFSKYTDGLPMLVEQALQSQKIWWKSTIEFEDLFQETQTWLKTTSMKEITK